MKAPLFILGFSYVLTLMLCIAFGEYFAIILSLVSLIISILIIIIKFLREKYKIFLAALLTASVASIAFICHVNFNEKPVLKLVDKNADIIATLSELPEENAGRCSYIFNVEKINVDGQELRLKFKTKILSSTPLDIEPYDRIEAKVRFAGIQDDGKYFSNKNYCRAKKIYVNAFFQNFSSYEILPRDSNSCYYYALKSRQNMVENMEYIFPTREAALINAIMFGHKQELDRNVKNNLESCGVSHIMAPSGFHMSVLFASIYYILIKLTKRKKVATSVSAIFILAFMALVGFPPSAVRAGFMAIFVCLSTLILKKADGLNSLGLVTILVCLINPFSPGDIGFVLSLFATLALIEFLPKFYNYLKIKLNLEDNEDSKMPDFLFLILNKILLVFSISVVVTIITLPFIVISFGRMSLVSPLANFCLVLPVSILMICGMILLILNFLQIPIILPLGSLFSKILADYIMDLSAIFAKFPFSSIIISQRFMILTVAGIIILLSVAIFLGFNKKIYHLFATLIILTVSIPISLQYFLHANSAKIFFMNMGNSVAISIKGQGINSLISCGNSISAEDYIVNYLEKQQLGSVDFALVTDTSPNALDATRAAIKTFKPKHILMQELCKAASLVDSEIGKTSNIKYYKEYAETVISNQLKLEILDDGKNTFVFFNLYDKSFLFCANGGDITKIPEEWRKCNFFIFNKTPKNMDLITCDYAIISMYENKEEKFLKKEIPLASNIISTVKNFGLEVEIEPNGKLKVAKL